MSGNKVAPTSSGELRSFLLSQMAAVASGKQEPSHAKAICNYAQQVYNTVNMEIKYAQAKSKMGESDINPVNFAE